MTMHNHHIIPRHAGGTDDPSNIVALSVPDHAEAHRKLYEEHGRWEDKIAWLGLTGQIGQEEITFLKQSEGGKKNLGRKHSDEVNKAKGRAGELNASYGKSLSLESRRKMSESSKGQIPWNAGKKMSAEYCKKNSEGQMGKSLSEEHKQKTSETMKGISKPKVECPHCGKVGGKPQMKRWHMR